LIDELFKTIPGADEVAEWFGKWPAFHDAEISKLQLHQDAVITFTVYAWNTTSEVDEKGYYRNEKYANVDFRLEGVSAINLAELTETGILFELSIKQTDKQLMLVMDSSYGINGTITFARCNVKLNPR